jgi:hypothetical protein
MPTIHVNRTKENNELIKIGDLLTHQLDIIREDILAGGIPSYTIDEVDIESKLTRITRLRSSDLSGPTSGTTLDYKLYVQVTELFYQYQMLKNCFLSGTLSDIYGVVLTLQIEHRKEDLKRLATTFIDSGDQERLAKVASADPTQPLADQLGFDPDDF